MRISGKGHCTVFVRNWWRVEKRLVFGNHYKSVLVPNPSARRTVLATGLTPEEALQMCDEYNKTHKPGRLSRKAEWTSQF